VFFTCIKDHWKKKNWIDELVEPPLGYITTGCLLIIIMKSILTAIKMMTSATEE
jgi:hypothetical protein